MRRARSVPALLGILAAALLVEGVRSYVFPLAVLLWLALLAILLDYLRRESWLSLVAAAALSWLLFFFQASVGLAALGMVAAVLLFLLIRPARRSRRFSGAALAAWVTLGPLVAWLAGIDVPRHMVTALQLRALSSLPVPALPGGNSLGGEFLALAITVLLIFAGVWLASRDDLRGKGRDWLAWGLTAALLVLALREAFVRPWGHPWLFFQAAAPAIGILTLMQEKAALSRRLVGAFVAVFILSMPAISANVTADYAQARATSIRAYAASLVGAPVLSSPDPRLESYVLPPRLLEIIGEGTVDATVDQIPFIVANGLAYQPSGALLSYADLPGLSGEQIGGDSGPRFIMLGLGDDGTRNPWPAGSLRNLELLTGYQSIWRFGDDFLLLEKLNQPRQLVSQPALQGVGQMGDALRMDEPVSLARVQATPRLSLAGQLASALALEPTVELVVQWDDGNRRVFSLTADQLAAGVQFAPDIATLDDAELFLTASGHLNRPADRFWLQGAPAWAYAPDFDYTVQAHAVASAAAAQWPATALPGGGDMQLRAAQANLVGKTVLVDLFWQTTDGGALDRGFQVSARLLDDQGDAVATQTAELRDRGPGLRTVAAGPERLLVTRLRLDLPDDAASAVYDLGITLDDADQPADSALWQTVLRDFVSVQPTAN